MCLPSACKLSVNMKPLSMLFDYMPNVISLSRCLVGVYLLLSNFWGWLSPKAYLAWFICAFVSDALDGWAARALRVTSVTGAFLDLCADKVLFLAVWLYIARHYADGIVQTAIILLLLREVLLVVVRRFAYQRGLVLSAENHGKYKTLYLGVLAVLTMMYAQQVSVGQAVVFDMLWLFGVIMSWYSLYRYALLFVTHQLLRPGSVKTKRRGGHCFTLDNMPVSNR